MQANLFGWIDALAHGAVAQAVLALSLVIAFGLAFGSLGVRGVRLGSAGVLFVGLFAGQAGLYIVTRFLKFPRDFGVNFFLYTLGFQGWPHFFSSFKRQGFECKILGVCTVLLAGLIL